MVYRVCRSTATTHWLSTAPRAYRLMMHTTADDQYKYRTKDEEEVWWRRDPLVRFRKYLEGRKYWSDKQQAALEDEFKAEIDKQIQIFESITDFSPEVAFDNVFGTTHAVIEEQRAAFLADMEKEAGDA